MRLNLSSSLSLNFREVPDLESVAITPKVFPFEKMVRCFHCYSETLGRGLLCS